MAHLRAPKDHALIGQASALPINEATPVISVNPIILSVPDRPVYDLQIRVTAPMTGNHLPIILLSHGQGHSNWLSSSQGYGPMVNFWASHGFVVIQPTHLSSNSLRLPAKIPGAPMFWQTRASDMKHIIDQLDEVESSVVSLKGRLDRSRIAVVGHSMGGHTASMLLGMKLTLEDGSVVDLTEPRIKAGVLLGAPGSGGDSLSEYAYNAFPFFRQPSFVEMRTPALVVVGDQDVNPRLNTKGAEWHKEPYTLSPAPKTLFTIFGAGHLFGGISGYDANETTDENIERVAVTLRLSWAYLCGIFYSGDKAWSEACGVLSGLEGVGKIESK